MNNNSDIQESPPSGDKDFYIEFENRYRGSPESIQLRQLIYAPFIEKLKKYFPALKALDLGCGRGEWLELLKGLNIHAIGVDIDPEMLAGCEKNGLDVRHQDVVVALKDLPGESLQIITGFHIAEHLPFDKLIVLCQEAYRVLSPGGLLILESPNSENIHVACSTFHLDPTHASPLPSKLLAYLLEFSGFSKSIQIGLNPDIDVQLGSAVSLQHVLISGVSRDYAVIGQKPANNIDISGLLDQFQVGKVKSLEEMVDRFDAQLNRAYMQLQDQQRRIARLEAPLRLFKKILSPFLKK